MTNVDIEGILKPLKMLIGIVEVFKASELLAAVVDILLVTLAVEVILRGRLRECGTVVVERPVIWSLQGRLKERATIVVERLVICVCWEAREHAPPIAVGWADGTKAC